MTGLADGGTLGQNIRKQGRCVGFQPEQLWGATEELQADGEDQWGQGGAEGMRGGQKSRTLNRHDGLRGPQGLIGQPWPAAGHVRSSSRRAWASSATDQEDDSGQHVLEDRSRSEPST